MNNTELDIIQAWLSESGKSFQDTTLVVEPEQHKSDSGNPAHGSGGGNPAPCSTSGSPVHVPSISSEPVTIMLKTCDLLPVTVGDQECLISEKRLKHWASPEYSLRSIWIDETFQLLKSAFRNTFLAVYL